MYYFVVNQSSGSGRALRTWSKVESYLKEEKIKYHVWMTESKTEVEEHLTLLKASNKAISAVVVLGGDGTIHEVVNQLAGSSLPFSVIPTGSGNDFARARGISKDYVREMKRIISGEQKNIDLMHTGRQHCLTVIGLGFDGMVAKVTNEMKVKKWLGSFSYIVSVLKVLRTYKPSHIYLTLDDVTHEFEDVWLVAVANHPFYGGGMKICPNASSEDGQLDICIIHGLSKWQLLRLFPSVFRGKHINSDRVKMMRGESIRVESDDRLVIHGDGEMIGETPISISIKKNGCRIIS